jgi:hypothetical protein
MISRRSRISWDRMERLWVERRLDEITATDVEALLRILIVTAARQRNHRGRSTGKSQISVACAIYNRAIADGLIERKDSPPSGRGTASTVLSSASTKSAALQTRTLVRVRPDEVVRDGDHLDLRQSQQVLDVCRGYRPDYCDRRPPYASAADVVEPQDVPRA